MVVQIEERKSSPWFTLARFIGPMLIWLSLSFLLLFFVFNTEWAKEIMEGESLRLSVILISAIASAIIGVILSAVGYSRPRVDFVSAKIKSDMMLCPTCDAELLKTSSICPYCGRDIVTDDMMTDRPHE